MITLLPKFKKHPKLISRENSMNPHHHWLLLLRIFLVALCLLIIFSLYLLYRIKNEQIFQVKPSSGKESTLLREDLLQKVTKSFEDKAGKQKNLKTNPPLYPDPSL